VERLRRCQESFAADEHVLGGSDFVTGMLSELEQVEARHQRQRGFTLEALVAKVSGGGGIPPDAMAGRGRRPPLARARQGLAFLWVERLGRSAPPLARLGMRPESVLKAARRDGAHAHRWRRLVESESRHPRTHEGGCGLIVFPDIQDTYTATPPCGLYLSQHSAILVGHRYISLYRWRPLE